jgi:predicted nucleic acid-binding protein
VTKPSVLDSFALLAYLGREPGYEAVRALLRDAEASNRPALINEINVGEVYYRTAKDRSTAKADACLSVLETLPIRIVGNTFAQVLDAARLKARYPIAYADAFALATALREQAVLVTGDPEFRAATDLVEIRWI